VTPPFALICRPVYFCDMEPTVKVSKGEATHTRIVHAALKLIQSQGLTGTGVNQILAAADAPRGSLYFHFPAGKEQLAGEAIGLASREIAAMIASMFASHQSVGGAIVGVVDSIIRDLEQTDYSTGCPVAAITLDAASSSATLQKQCSDAYSHWQDLLCHQLELDGHTRGSAESLSVVVLSLIEGATVVSRAQRSTAPLAAAASAARVLIEHDRASRVESQ
jgi:TetR/AcrR family transcriptional repressor of lmrAB and yxaGH operons